MNNKILDEDIKIIKKVIKEYFNEAIIDNIQRLGGLTNRTYAIKFTNGIKTVLRIPGEKTEDIIKRDDEKISTELANKLGIDAKLYFFNDDGVKMSEYLENSITMSEEIIKSKDNIEKVAKIFRKLHDCGEDTGVDFDVFKMAENYEKIINEYCINMFSDYDDVKRIVMKIKNKMDSNYNIIKVPCHNDPLCENWILSNGRMYLIDWEYAGMNDAMWDLADLSIEANLSYGQEEYLLKTYTDNEVSQTQFKLFVANKIYVDYLWTLWAKSRIPFDGSSMDSWAKARYERLKNNIEKFKEYNS